MALRRTTIDGRQLTPRIAQRGDLLGILALVGRGAPSDAVVLTTARTLNWSGPTIRSVAETDAGLALGLLAHVLASFEVVVERLDGLLYQDAVRRVARVLYEYRQMFFGDRPVLTRSELPTLVGTSREMTGRVVRALEQRGIVQRMGRHGLRLADLAGLEELALPSKAESGRRGRSSSPSVPRDATVEASHEQPPGGASAGRSRNGKAQSR